MNNTCVNKSKKNIFKMFLVRIFNFPCFTILNQNEMEKYEIYLLIKMFFLILNKTKKILTSTVQLII